MRKQKLMWHYCYKYFLLIKNKTFILQFIQYCVIGSVNTLVSYILFWFFCSLFKIQSLSLFLSTLGGVFVSYFLNSRFNFKVRVTKVKYLLFIIFLLMLSYFVGYMGDLLSSVPLVTFIVSIFITLPIGFLFSKFVIFKK